MNYLEISKNVNSVLKEIEDDVYSLDQIALMLKQKMPDTLIKVNHRKTEIKVNEFTFVFGKCTNNYKNFGNMFKWKLITYINKELSYGVIEELTTRHCY